MKNTPETSGVHVTEQQWNHHMCDLLNHRYTFAMFLNTRLKKFGIPLNEPVRTEDMTEQVFRVHEERAKAKERVLSVTK